MYFIYYDLIDIETKEERKTMFDSFVGDIGDKIIFENKEYIVKDYAEEYFDLEEPEDY